MSQWVLFYATNAQAVKSQIARFVEVFPSGTIWANAPKGDVVLIGTIDAPGIDVTHLLERFDRADYRAVVASLSEVGFHGPLALFATYAGQRADLTGWLQDVPINRDRNLLLQYIAGLGLNRDERHAIYRDLVRHRTFPDTLFSADDAWKQRLRHILASPRQ